MYKETLDRDEKLAAFYREHKVEPERGNVSYNEDLFVEVWGDKDYEGDIENVYMDVHYRFWEDLKYLNTYYEPLVFNAKIALQCGLTPFTLHKSNFLALQDGEINLSARLHEYLAMTHDIITNEALATNKCFNSGLYYDESFYKCYEFAHETLEEDELIIYYDKELMSKEWGTKNVKKRFWKNLRSHYIYYKPRVFDEEIALQCGLTPFFYDEPSFYNLSLLAVSEFEQDLRPRLDAYQFFTHGTIDEKSSFFLDKEFFEKAVGKEIITRMDKVLNIN